MPLEKKLLSWWGTQNHIERIGKMKSIKYKLFIPMPVSFYEMNNKQAADKRLKQEKQVQQVAAFF